MPITLNDAKVETTLTQAQQGIPANGLTPSPEDWRDCWIYFLMVDRFNNPVKPPVTAFDAVFDGFQGGTIEGMRQKLDYLKDLGVGAVWFTPVLKNCQFLNGQPDEGSYHGYGIQNFLEIDPRFGSGAQDVEAELRQFVDEAHAKGLYVIFDIVLNHTGDVFAYPPPFGSQAPSQDHPYNPIHWRDENGNPREDWTDAHQIDDPTGEAAVLPVELRRNEFFRRQGLPGGQETIGDFASLKQMLTANHELGALLIRFYQYLIAAFDIDGFRVDTLKYLEPDFALRFGNAVREFALSVGKKNFFTYGEVYDSEEKIAQFIGRNVSASFGDMVGVDAALDFPLFDKLPGVMKGTKAPSEIVTMYQRRKEVENGVISSHGEATRFFVTFLDNHDQKNRFHYVDAQDPHRYDAQTTMALACLFSLPGIPCVYYGTEQGLHGAGNIDQAVREALWGAPRPFDPAHPFHVALKRVAEVRTQLPALRYGRFYFRPISGGDSQFGASPVTGGVLAFSRILNDEEVVVVANTNTQDPFSRTIIVDSTLNPPGTVMEVRYSNQENAISQATVFSTGAVQIAEVDGGFSTGPACVIEVTVRPMEAIILARRAN